MSLDALLVNIDPAQQDAIRAAFQQASAAAIPLPPATRTVAEIQAEARDVARTLAAVLKPAKPDPYDGAIDADSCLNFLDSQAEYFKLVKLEDSLWVPYTVANLRKDARAWWRSSGLDMDKISWASFKQVFTAYHTPPNTVTAARAALDRLQQRHLTVAAYTHQFRRLLRLIPGIDSDTVLHTYVRGLEPTTCKEVRLRQPTTLDQAHHMATELHSILHPTDLHLHTANTPSAAMEVDNMSVDPVAAIAALRVELHNVRQQLFNNPNGQSHGRLTPAERTRLMQRGACFRCRRDGHMAKDCSAYNQQPRRQFNNVTVEASIPDQGKASDN